MKGSTSFVVHDEISRVVLTNIKRKMVMAHLDWRLIKPRLVTADRVFFETDFELVVDLTNGNFERGLSSGGPHKMVYSLFEDVPGVWGTLTSFREKARPSLQVTLANKGERIFGDADIDLSNPFYDVWGAIVHAIEVFIPGKTDHVKLEPKIAAEYEKWCEIHRA